MDRPTTQALSTGASIRQAMVAGSLAGLLSMAVLGVAGRRENRSAAAPINAVSHWDWGDEALHRQQADVAHTLTGFATHHGASLFWAGLFAWVAKDWPALRTPKGVVYGSIATSALACFVDFQLTPSASRPATSTGCRTRRWPAPTPCSPWAWRLAPWRCRRASAVARRSAARAPTA